MTRKLAALALMLMLGLPAWALAATPVDINKADAAAIAGALDGIGLSKAQAIVAWRDAHGPFKKVDDLRHVKGIGKTTIERNRAAIRLGDDGGAPDAEPDAGHRQAAAH